MSSPDAAQTDRTQDTWGGPWSRFRFQPSEAECIATVLCFLLAIPVVLRGFFGAAIGQRLLPVVSLVGGLLAAAWLVRLVLVALRWSKRRRALTEHKVAWMLLPMTVVVVALGIWIVGDAPLAFDEARWRSVATGSLETHRWRMIDDVCENYLQRGMGRASVVSRLGPPTSGGWTSSSLRWWLRKSKTPGESWWLDLHFASGKLLEWSVVQGR